MSAEIRANYFADLSGGYHRRQRLATWLILVLSSGAAAAFLAGLPARYSWLGPVLSLLTAALSAYVLAVQNQKGAMDCADLHFRWNALAGDYQRLWDDMYAEDALAKLTAIDNRAMEVSKAATAFPVIKRRLLKWQDHVERHHAQAVHTAPA